MSNAEDQSIEERRQRLKDAAARKQKMNGASQWDPAEGEMLKGEFLGVRQGNHKNFGEFRVYYVEEFETGDVYKVLGRTMLDSAMQSQSPEPGDLVAVTYEGTDNSPDARGEFHAYDVVTA